MSGPPVLVLIGVEGGPAVRVQSADSPQEDAHGRISAHSNAHPAEHVSAGHSRKRTTTHSNGLTPCDYADDYLPEE